MMATASENAGLASRAPAWSAHEARINRSGNAVPEMSFFERLLAPKGVIST